MNESERVPIDPSRSGFPEPVLIPVVMLAAALIELGVGSVLGNDPGAAWLLGRRMLTLPISIAAFLVLGQRLGMRMKESLGLTLANLRRYAWRGLLLGMVLAPLLLGLNMLVREIFPSQTKHPAFQLMESGGWGSVASVIAMAVILAPVAEEILYRGVIFLGVSGLAGMGWGLAVSSILFGAAHYSVWPDPIPLALLGLILGLCFKGSGTLWMPIFAHAGFNGLMLALSLSVMSERPTVGEVESFGHLGIRAVRSADWSAESSLPDECSIVREKPTRTNKFVRGTLD